jgi:hypothetical protein
MSRHTFQGKTSEGIEVYVCAGWDNPFQGYHLTISKKYEDEDEQPLYDNMNVWLWPQNTKPFEEIVSKMGIESPDGFWEMVRRNR